MSDAIKGQVERALKSAGIGYGFAYRGETVRPENWKCDEWTIAFSKSGASGDYEFLPLQPGKPTFSTPYFTGLGHRNAGKSKNPPYAMRKNPNPPRTTDWVRWEAQHVKPRRPHPADVLHSLCMDLRAEDQSFRDWCSDFGYSDDSIKSLNIYQQCCAIGPELRKVFKPELIVELRRMLQDY